MTIKNVFLGSLVILPVFFGCTINAHTRNVEKALAVALPGVSEDYEKWYNGLSGGDKEAYSEDRLLNLITRMNADHTPEYKEMEKFDDQMFKIEQQRYRHLGLCSKKNQLLQFFDEDCKVAKRLTEELKTMREERERLCEKALSTPEYKRWEQGWRR